MWQMVVAWREEKRLAAKKEAHAQFFLEAQLLAVRRERLHICIYISRSYRRYQKNSLPSIEMLSNGAVLPSVTQPIHDAGA
jgi:hypothetical protein